MRRCEYDRCLREIPEEAHPLRRYCSSTCRNGAHLKRLRDTRDRFAEYVAENGTEGQRQAFAALSAIPGFGLANARAIRAAERANLDPRS